MLAITLSSSNDFIQSVQLEGSAYKLHFAWNSVGFWTLDIRGMDNTDICRGIRILPNFPLLAQHRRQSGLPPGELLAVSVPGSEDIGRNSFDNGAVTLVYVTGDEVNAALEKNI